MAMLTIDSPSFNAGAVLLRQTCVRAAPIIQYMIGWSEDRIRAYARARGWTVTKEEIPNEQKEKPVAHEDAFLPAFQPAERFLQPNLTLRFLQQNLTLQGAKTSAPEARSPKFDGPHIKCSITDDVAASPTTDVPTSEEVINMLKIETHHSLDGENLKHLSDDTLFKKIAQAESQIEELDKIQNKPKALKNRIDTLRSDIEKLVAFMDDRSDKSEKKNAA